MGAWHDVDRRPRGLTDEVTSFQFAKARKFATCAELFRCDSVLHASVIRSLLTPCPGTESCHTQAENIQVMGTDALAWLEEHPERGAMAPEHRRLYGGKDWADQMPLIPPCACSYLSEPVDGTVADALSAYGAVGFAPLTESGLCPAHISNELDFMAHCLSAAAKGDQAAVIAARAFMVTHLFHWGVVFAAATCASAEVPPMRFAGAVLEQLLFCELEQATRRDEPYRLTQSPFPL